MDPELDVQVQQARLLAEALKIQKLGHTVPHLGHFFPDNKNDIEIQLFNLTGKLPQRLSGEEDIAMWILESEFLNRARVCKYLGTAPEAPNVSSTGVRYRREDIPRSVLKKLASKICSLDVAKGFVEGMKLFVPVVGCWDLFVEKANTTSSDAGLDGQEVSVLKRILTEYVSEHAKHSDKPLFPGIPLSDANVNTMVEIALCVLGLSKVLHEGTKSSSTAMADFFADLRTVLREQASPASNKADSADGALNQSITASPAAAQGALSMSMKTMTDLFTATSTGLPLVSLAESHRNLQLNASSTRGATLAGSAPRPSYLFAEHLLSGAVTLGWNLEEPLVSKFARLTHDALYIFGPESELPEGCIPLEAVHVRTQDGTSGAGRSALLTLTGLSGTAVPYVHLHQADVNATTTPVSVSSASVQFQQPFRSVSQVSASNATSSIGYVAVPSGGPRAVTYHAYVLLNIVSPVGVSVSESCDLWVDTLESAAWECRASRSHLRNVKPVELI